MVSLGKTNTPEFGSPCYTEPDVAPPAVTPWDRSRMAGGSSGGAAAAVAAGPGAGGPGLGRRRLDPDPGVVLRPGRPQADAGPDQRLPDVRRGHRAWRRPGRSPGPCATPRRCSTCSPVVGSATRPGRHRPSEPFLAACDREPGRLRIARFIEPVITDAAVDPECVQAWEDASRAARVARPRGRGHRRTAAARGGADLRDLLGGAHRAVRWCRRSRSRCCARSPGGWPSAAARSAGRSSVWRSARCVASRPAAWPRSRRTTPC